MNEPTSLIAVCEGSTMKVMTLLTSPQVQLVDSYTEKYSFGSDCAASAASTNQQQIRKLSVFEQVENPADSEASTQFKLKLIEEQTVTTPKAVGHFSLRYIQP